MVEPLRPGSQLPAHTAGTSIWNPAPQAPVASVTPASASFWTPGPFQPAGTASRSSSQSRHFDAPPPGRRDVSPGPTLDAPRRKGSRGRSRSTSTSVVYDLLMKTTTGQRGSLRTASQPPQSMSINANSAIASSRQLSAGLRPRLKSAASEGQDFSSDSHSTPSSLADLHESPLPTAVPQLRSPTTPVWNESPGQRSPLFERHHGGLLTAAAQQATPPHLHNGSAGAGGGGGSFPRVAGTSLPANNWTSPRGRQGPGNAPSPPGLGRPRELSPAGNGSGGIGYSNMSPFTRDGSRPLPFGGSPIHPMSYAGAGRPREHSMSAIGSGRRGVDVYNGPVWNSSVDEDDEDEQHLTKSGATSRRHSLAVLPPRTAQVRLETSLIPPCSRAMASAQVSHGFAAPSGAAPSPRHDVAGANAGGYGGRTLGFTDDELSAGLNSLQLNIDAQTQAQQQQQQTMQTAYATSPSQRLNMAPLGTSPTVNAQAAARAYFTGEAPHATTFSPFYASGAEQQPSIPARSMPPFASSVTYPSTVQQTIDLMGPPVYFGAQAHPQPELVDLGKGLPLHLIPASSLLYFVEFKAGRTDLFYVADPGVSYQKGDLVIVEADRGKDLGRVVHDGITRDDVHAFQRHQMDVAISQMTGKEPADEPEGVSAPLHQQSLSKLVKDIHPKEIYGLASPSDVGLLATKMSDEAKALMIVRAKVEARQLPMAPTDAEWQIDRRKLTIFYVSNRRIDFRELVRELFKVFKTRLWFSALQREIEGPVPRGVF